MSSRSCRRGLGSAGRRSCPTLPSGGCFGGEAFKGALRPCFRSPERWCRSDEPGARPLTGIGQVRVGPLEEHRARDLVRWIRPAWPASSWWSPSTSITPRGCPSAPAAPRTWCGGSVRLGRRAAGGARRPRSRPGDGHRRRRRRAPGAADPSGAAGEQLVEPSTSITSRGCPSAPAAPRTWCVRRGGAIRIDSF